MRVYFVRHAQSMNNAMHQSEHINFVSRHHDPPLTLVGKQQAEFAAAWLYNHIQKLCSENQHHNHDTPLAILSSPMIRALETAQVMSKQFNSLPIIVMPSICETGGVFSGSRVNSVVSSKDSKSQKHSHDVAPSNQSESFHNGITVDALYLRFPTVSVAQNIQKNGWWFGSRETSANAYTRACNFSRLLWLHALMNPKSTLIIITHGLFLDMLLKSLLNSTGLIATQPTPPKEMLACSNYKKDAEPLTAWPDFESASPTTFTHSNDPSYFSLSTHFLCNNVGISLLELFVDSPSHLCNEPCNSQLLSHDNSLQNMLHLKLGILFWNQCFFLKNDLLRKSNHEVFSFSTF
ncbi:uncharacterized protein LOC128883853 isoform X2 [Hylaeus volcanicus]|uniref:uncharacterized protein LOC128883853 isoform X2 n=1 Tax=Hylaeus volcanicus TaxID=313075 RepID=UPI0023B78690|nr:uncharacterized protein LOC128883853 isoform X2 [Hylaeus volcanicus]